MSDRGVLIYVYDGSYDGLLSAVFDAFVDKHLPADICSFQEQQTLLYIHEVKTNLEHAKRVEVGIAKKLGGRAYLLVKKCFLYGEGGKEMAIMRFLWKGFREGANAVSQLGDPDVNIICRYARAVGSEAHNLLGFTRFTDSGGVLTAVIHPKHYVLPIMRNHFVKRLLNENFMIYDETHKMALIHAGGRTGIIPVEDLEQPKDEEDKFYQGLWKSYYRHIAISSRYNPKCRISHMPKRFWQDMPEVIDELESTYKPDLSRGTKEEIARRIEEEKLLRLEAEEKKRIELQNELMLPGTIYGSEFVTTYMSK